MEKDSLAIVVLNWNNAPDAIECIASLLEATNGLTSMIFIVDNGSEDDSVFQLQNWLSNNGVCYAQYKIIKQQEFQPVSEEKDALVYLIETQENLGFAKGNNVVVRFALNHFSGMFEKFLLLNNDTLVPPGAIKRLLEISRKHPDFLVWTPVITYAGQKDKVWNAGGFLGRWGGRKYLGHKQHRSQLPGSGIRQISFITGCALLMDKSIPERDIFLNEDFFFGEEDYYFSMQMKHLGIKIGVVFDSVIYHKISSSIQQVSPESQLPLFYIHYLNRIIDIKKWMSPLTFIIWKPGFVLHAAFNVWWKRWYSFSAMLKFTRLLVKHSQNKTQVTKEDFFGARKLFTIR